MIRLDSAELAHLARTLQRFSADHSIPLLAGLLTVPAFQANAVRIEALVHLAVANCSGSETPTKKDVQAWLNRELEAANLAMLEDPPEDLFVTNVCTNDGNRRVFEGLWEGSAYSVQTAIDTLSADDVPEACASLLRSAKALLLVSDAIADRVGLQRWTVERSHAKAHLVLPRNARVDEHARAVTFTADEISALSVTREALSPFVLRQEDRAALRTQDTENSVLVRRPLVELGGRLVVALPNAISAAVRLFLLTELRREGLLTPFGHALARVQADQLESEGLFELKGDAESLVHPGPDRHVGRMHSILLKHDTDKYLHIMLMHDDLEQVIDSGLGSYREFPELLRSAVELYIAKIAAFCAERGDCRAGMTLIVLGGIGRGALLGFKSLPRRWPVWLVGGYDLLTLAHDGERPVTRFIKCARQRNWVTTEGVGYINISGDFNFFCYWREVGYQMVPRELAVSAGSTVVVPTDMMFPVRRKVTTLFDRHVVPTASGTQAMVARLNHDSYFESLRRRPIYASFDHLRSGVLAGVIETARGPTWLFVGSENADERVRRSMYEVWSGFMGPLERLLANIELRFPGTHGNAIEIRLDFSDADVLDGERGPIKAPGRDLPAIDVRRDARVAVVRLPQDFFRHFNRPENAGEQLMIRTLAAAAVRLLEPEPMQTDEESISEMASSVLRDAGARIIHLFQLKDPLAYLAMRHAPPPTFVAHEDFVLAKLDLSKGCVEAGRSGHIDGKEECNTFLHKVVQKVWGGIRTTLRQLDRASTIRHMLGIQEAIFQDRVHWKRTARAMMSLYAPEDDVLGVARRREKERNESALPSRTIIEMALCECPLDGGRPVSRSDIDELIAKAALLIEAATDSDAVQNGISEPHIELHANGEYTIERKFYDTVISPFVAGLFKEEFEEAAAEYESLYDVTQSGDGIPAKEVFSPAFVAAFRAEFGLPPATAANAVAALLDAAVESDRLVIETTRGGIAARLIDEGGLSRAEADAFLRAFGLISRPKWERAPRGFRDRELYPWRFSRRLSAVSRPVLLFGASERDAAFYGATSLRAGVGYVLARAEDGQLPSEFFVSSEMRQYVGATNDGRGHAFARGVAEELRKRGWNTRAEVQMTELGAGPEFGDLDVIAWGPGGEVQLIECKRLRLARTVAEIAEVCSRFRGEARDDLDRHVRRVNWVRDHLTSLERIVGYTPSRSKITMRLVTNTHVPMMYVQSLPMPRERIGPL